MSCIDPKGLRPDRHPSPGPTTSPLDRTGFVDAEKRILLSQPGIGATVIRRLEQCGICSLAALRERGVPQVATAVAQAQGNMAWRNRVRALERALESGSRAVRPDKEL